MFSAKVFSFFVSLSISWMKEDGGVGIVLKEDDSRNGCIIHSVDENGAAGRV